DPATPMAGRNRADDRALLQVDFADQAGVVVADERPRAVFRSYDAVRLGGALERLDHLSRGRVDQHDLVVPVDGGNGERPGANPSDALGVVADGDLAHRLTRLQVDDGDGPAIGVGDEQLSTVRSDVEQTVGRPGGGTGGRQQQGG